MRVYLRSFNPAAPSPPSPSLREDCWLQQAQRLRFGESGAAAWNPRRELELLVNGGSDARAGVCSRTFTAQVGLSVGRMPSWLLSRALSPLVHRSGARAVHRLGRAFYATAAASTFGRTLRRRFGGFRGAERGRDVEAGLGSQASPPRPDLRIFFAGAAGGALCAYLWIQFPAKRNETEKSSNEEGLLGNGRSSHLPTAPVEAHARAGPLELPSWGPSLFSDKFFSESFFPENFFAGSGSAVVSSLLSAAAESLSASRAFPYDLLPDGEQLLDSAGFSSLFSPSLKQPRVVAERFTQGAWQGAESNEEAKETSAESSRVNRRNFSFKREFRVEHPWSPEPADYLHSGENRVCFLRRRCSFPPAVWRRRCEAGVAGRLLLLSENAGFSRGHLAAAALHSESAPDLAATFSLAANVSPQKQSFNAGHWWVRLQQRPR